jgi:hypothetical protein
MMASVLAEIPSKHFLNTSREEIAVVEHPNASVTSNTSKVYFVLP